MGSLSEPTKAAMQKKGWHSWEGYALTENGTGNLIAAIAPFDATQAIFIEYFESDWLLIPAR